MSLEGKPWLFHIYVPFCLAYTPESIQQIWILQAVFRKAATQVHHQGTNKSYKRQAHRQQVFLTTVGRGTGNEPWNVYCLVKTLHALTTHKQSNPHEQKMSVDDHHPLCMAKHIPYLKTASRSYDLWRPTNVASSIPRESSCRFMQDVELGELRAHGQALILIFSD